MYASKVYSKTFILPAFLIFFLLFLLPSILGFYYSLTNWNSMSDTVKFIGLQNFKEAFTDSSNFMFAKNTVLYAVFTSLFKGMLGLALALMLNEGIRSKNVLRTIFFTPVIISNLIVGLLFQQILHPTNGILNGFLHTVGLDFVALPWLEDPHLVMWATVWVEVWKAAGFNMIIFLAGLQMVPKEMYEACDIDGGRYWSKLRYVTLPYIKPAIVINTMMNIIAGIKVFDVIFALTNGGPGRASEVVNLTVFNQFSAGNYGYGTALGTIMFVFLTLLTLSMVKLFSQSEE